MKVNRSVSMLCRRALLGVAALAVFVFSTANAQTNLNKKFFFPSGTQVSSSSPANPGQVVKLRFSVFNQNVGAITNVSFSDFFTTNGLQSPSPALTGIQLTQSPPVLNVVPGTACVGASGTGAAAPTAAAVSAGTPASVLTGVTVSGFGVRAPIFPETRAECQIEVEVVAINGGDKPNVVPANTMSVNDSTANANSPISETFIVRTITGPAVTKGFGGGAGSTNNQTLTTGDPATLRIRINNADTSQAINTVQVIDRLPLTPAGLQYNTTTAPVFSAACAGTPAPSVIYSNGTSGTNNVATIRVANIAANGNCDVQLTVVGNAGGTFPNRILSADITTREAVTDSDGSNTATLTYQTLTTAKSFNPTLVDRKSTTDSSTTISKLTIRLSNPSTSAVTGAEFTDYFTNGGSPTDADLNLRVSTPPNLVFNPSSCGTSATSIGRTLGATPSDVLLDGAAGYAVRNISIPAATGAGVGTCDITIDVFGTSSIAGGTITNTLRQENVVVNGNQATFTNATANLEITPTGVTGRTISAQNGNGSARMRSTVT